ncbi:MAG: hypothetical protein NT051_03010 [Candidatus Micrarchaeota archaeon]|nr:hypothetical protein [Candidatus Micrarchaeota archaeon]
MNMKTASFKLKLPGEKKTLFKNVPLLAKDQVDVFASEITKNKKHQPGPAQTLTQKEAPLTRSDCTVFLYGSAKSTTSDGAGKRFAAITVSTAMELADKLLVEMPGIVEKFTYARKVDKSVLIGSGVITGILGAAAIVSGDVSYLYGLWVPALGLLLGKKYFSQAKEFTKLLANKAFEIMPKNSSGGQV